VQSGVVALIQSGGPYGLHTLIAHGDRVSSFYAHQSRSVVAVGQLVKQGDVIGYVGSTGWVTGPHLHFEMHVDGQPYDPMGWFGGAKTAIRC
jgi:murein DD-endopeptidase MepM/ murein hydrolase activator NlpD